MILLCNNFVNSAAAAIVTVISLHVGGEGFAAVGVGVFTVVLIIFGEVAPKTFGALYPERLALPAALVYQVLLKILYPIVWATNLVANGVLRLLGVSPREGRAARRSASDELRTVVAEASTVIPHRHQRMLMSILDLETHQRRGHHGAAQRDRRHRRVGRLGRRARAAAREPAHAHSGATRAASTT